VSCCGCHGGAPAPAPAPKPKEGAALNAPATIVASVPADAKISIDDNPTSSTGANRVFSTPVLQTGMEYYYTIKGEVVRDGQTLVTTKKVAVRAGEETRISLEFPVASVASR
jgi:uncharacterized protein (TIGR03000 family)